MSDNSRLIVRAYWDDVAPMLLDEDVEAPRQFRALLSYVALAQMLDIGDFAIMSDIMTWAAGLRMGGASDSQMAQVQAVLAEVLAVADRELT